MSEKRIISLDTLYETKGLARATRILWLEEYTHAEICTFTQKYFTQKCFETRGLLGVPIIIAVVGPKGGPGKSTVAIALAYALAQQGVITALLDSDINDANDALMVRGDTNEITSRDKIHADFGEHPSVLDNLLGRKHEGQKRVSRIPFEEIAIRSKTLPNLYYLLSEQLGDKLGERGTKTQRDRAARAAEKKFLEQARKLKNYNAVVIDNPAGTPSHLDAFVGADARVYVVNFKNFSSFTGIENIARLVYDSHIGGNNHLVVNHIKGVKTKEDLERRLSYLGIGGAVEKLEVGNIKAVKRLVANTNLRLKGLGLDKLAFVSDTFLPDNEDIEFYSNEYGEPYLMAIAKRKSKRYQARDVFRREMHYLAENIIKSTLEGLK